MRSPTTVRGSGLRTPSLRRRVTLVVLALLALMLVALAVVTDVVLEDRLDGQLRQRLSDRASVASALVDQVEPRDLARRLEGDGVSVVLRTASGQVYAEGPLGGTAANGGASEGAQTPGSAGPAAGSRGAPGGPPGPKTPVVQQGDRLTVVRTLSDGSRLTLLADVSDVRRTLGQVRLALVLAAALVLLGAAVVVPPVVARTLRPLDRITEVARSITEGDRERRLRPVQPGTELGRTAIAFDDMLDSVVGAESRALASEQRLRTFLSDAAHELRTPLAGVQAAAEHLLRDDPPRADREQAMLGLVRESMRASRLVEDMLTMARIDSGLSLRRTTVDLRELAQQVVDGRTIQSPGLLLRLHGPQAHLFGDRDRLTQVLGNLLDNAAHACVPEGTVDLTVWADDERTGVDVEDDGPGVPAQQRERVFDRLVRLDEARSSHRSGAGLGLPIARGIARAHGGDLVCLPRSDGGAGAMFRLALPVARR